MLKNFETQALAFESIGECIFCGASPPDVKLTLEHVVPFFLSATGECVFKDGSCVDCNAYANKMYEQPAANADFLVPRLLLALKRRDKKSKPLPPIYIGSEMKDPMQLTADKLTTFVERNLYPKLLIFNVTDRPGLLSGVDRGSGLRSIRALLLQIDDYISHGANVGQVFNSNSTAPAYTVAKIGYSFAVGAMGLTSFDGDQIRDLLFGRRDDIWNFVGNAEKYEINISKRFLHRVTFFRESGYLVARVGLFSAIGMVPYEVVLGKAST